MKWLTPAPVHGQRVTAFAAFVSWSELAAAAVM